MTLKLKVIILTITLLVATAALNFAVLHSFIMPAFTDLELARADRDVQRMQGVFHEEMRDLSITADDWDELSPKTPPTAYTVRTVPARLDGADPWAEIASVRQSITTRIMKDVGA